MRTVSFGAVEEGTSTELAAREKQSVFDPSISAPLRL